MEESRLIIVIHSDTFNKKTTLVWRDKKVIQELEVFNIAETLTHDKEALKT